MSKKDDEIVDKSRLLEDVQEFCISQSFEAQFEAFAREHANVFLKALDFTDGSTEHPLEFHDVYRKYLSTFEGLIEDFIVKVCAAQYIVRTYTIYFPCLTMPLIL